MKMWIAIICLAMATPALAQDTPNWAVQCVAPERDAPLVCSASQTIVDAQSGQPILSVQVQDQPALSAPVLIVQIASGLYIPAGVSFGALSIPIETCTNNTCIASSVMTDEIAQVLTSGAPQELAFETDQRQPATLTILTEGFAEAYPKIRVAR
ncbi:MAG: invasion associated locus B family protein [Pseudomonadota bacterium]